MKEKLPEFLRQYFWDVDFGELDGQKDAFFITKRVLDRGTTQALSWVISEYGVDKIRQVVTGTRDLDRSTANFWADILVIKKEEVPCLNKPYSPIHFGLYS